MRNALALQTTFAEPENVTTVTDHDAFDDPNCLVYADHSRRIIDMIEEELCALSPDGTHSYIRKQSDCCYCGMAGPWKRRDMCRQM
jgi:hypothetical protein